MASFGYNSILQDNDNVFRDGSLSVYYGELKQTLREHRNAARKE